MCFVLYCRFISADVQANLDLLLGTDSLIQRRSAALFLLKLKEFRKISQVTIDDIVNKYGGVFSHSASGVDENVIECLREVFTNVPSPFQGLETRHLQEKFYREHLGLVVSVCALSNRALGVCIMTVPKYPVWHSGPMQQIICCCFYGDYHATNHSLTYVISDVVSVPPMIC